MKIRREFKRRKEIWEWKRDARKAREHREIVQPREDRRKEREQAAASLAMGLMPAPGVAEPSQQEIDAARKLWADSLEGMCREPDPLPPEKLAFSKEQR